MHVFCMLCKLQNCGNRTVARWLVALARFFPNMRIFSTAWLSVVCALFGELRNMFSLFWRNLAFFSCCALVNLGSTKISMIQSSIPWPSSDLRNTENVTQGNMEVISCTKWIASGMSNQKYFSCILRKALIAWRKSATLHFLGLRSLYSPI